MKRVVTTSADSDKMYWYFTRHGVMPGSIPKNGCVGDIKDTPNGTYFQFDRPMTTAELAEYEIKEQSPDSIEECTIASSIASHTSDASAPKFGIGSKVYSVDRDPSEIGIIEDIVDDTTYGVQWDNDFEYAHVDQLRPADSTSNADQLEYIDELGSAVIDILESRGFNASVSSDQDFFEIEINEGDTVVPVYVIPISDIVPIKEDLQQDASQLAEAALDEYYK